jgi:hypothetical protein
MTAAKAQHHPRVDQDALLFLDRFLECPGWQPGHARQAADDFRPLRVDLLHAGVVSRHRWRCAQGVLLELFKLGELEIRIEFPLIADGAFQPVADVRTAGGAMTVGWIDDDTIRKGEIEFPKRREKLPGEFLGFAGPQQVRPACRVHEQGVPGKNAPGSFRVIFPGNQKTNMLRRMARRVPHGDDRFTEDELVAVLQLLVIESITRSSFVTQKYLGGFHPVAKLAGTADQVGVNVGFKNVGDGELFFTPQIDIFPHIRGGIENRRDARGIVTQQVRDLRDAFRCNALENQRHSGRYDCASYVANIFSGSEIPKSMKDRPRYQHFLASGRVTLGARIRSRSMRPCYLSM